MGLIVRRNPHSRNEYTFTSPIWPRFPLLPQIWLYTFTSAKFGTYLYDITLMIPAVFDLKDLFHFTLDLQV